MHSRWKARKILERPFYATVVITASCINNPAGLRRSNLGTLTCIPLGPQMGSRSGPSQPGTECYSVLYEGKQFSRCRLIHKGLRLL